MLFNFFCCRRSCRNNCGCGNNCRRGCGCNKSRDCGCRDFDRCKRNDSKCVENTGCGCVNEARGFDSIDCGCGGELL